jgi:hypothetical protein
MRIMNRAQRIVVVLYCLLVVYCCVWVPWHIVTGPANDGDTDQVRAGYGWLWGGPSNFDSMFFAASVTTPDYSIVGLRLLAATALAGAGFLVATRVGAVGGARKQP